jgi:hypothetical protein
MRTVWVMLVVNVLYDDVPPYVEVCVSETQATDARLAYVRAEWDGEGVPGVGDVAGFFGPGSDQRCWIIPVEAEVS